MQSEFSVKQLFLFDVLENWENTEAMATVPWDTD